jgi:uncharacterized protein DUF6089
VIYRNKISCLKSKPIQAIMVKCALFCLCLGIHLLASCQSDFPKFELGVNAGAFVYQGDLTPSPLGSYKTLKPELNLFVNRILNTVFSLRTSLALGRLKGDDAKYSSPGYRQQRNLNFKSRVFEVSELLVADIFGNNLSRRSSGLSPYLFAGLGFSLINVRREWSRFNAEYFSSEANTLSGLAADQQHPLPILIPVLPIGIGIRYPISSRISINAETSYRFTSTDYLDGFSKTANAARRDSYMSHTLGLIYQFKNNSWLKCPTF